MFAEIESLVRYEQYRDMRRHAQRERLARQACAGQQVTQPGVWVLGLVRRLAGSLPSAFGLAFSKSDSTVQ